MTPAGFKRTIRDLQVWCSSCMVAFAGSDPIGVLIGAKRPSGTLIHTIAVHPDHRRQGHGRHMLTSLASKLAILGPPRMIAEIPDTLADVCGLFSASGYVEEALLTDYVLRDWENDATGIATGAACPERAPQGGASRTGFVIPVTVDDLAANGLLDDGHPQPCWERSVETLTARKDEIAGLAVASDEQIEACILCTGDGVVLSLRSFVDDGGARLRQLFSRLHAAGTRTFRFPKVHPAEFSKECLETLGFRPAGTHRLYGAQAAEP